jgi:glycosyltransferase involved in cell wall biosynthesis
MPFHRIAPSTWLKETVEKRFGVPVDGPVPNGLDSRIFFRDEPGSERHDPTRIGLLYRREFWKGMDDALHALRKVKEARRSVRIVLFGNGLKRSDRPLMEGLGGPEWHESPHGTELREIYDSLDIFVFSSIFEGFGNPPLEAMARGAACVTTAVGGVPDYSVDGETALWVPPGDPRRLAEAVLALIDDEPRRKSLAEAGSRYVRRFTWESSAEQLEGIFERVLASGPGPG